MNSITGKSTGIALLMAAALIAALFAMGVFSAGTVGAHDPTNDTDGGHAATDPTHGPAHGELSGITLTPYTAVGAQAGAATLDPPAPFDEDEHEYNVDVGNSVRWIGVTAAGAGEIVDEDITITSNARVMLADLPAASATGVPEGAAIRTAIAAPGAFFVDATDFEAYIKIVALETTPTDPPTPLVAGTYVLTLVPDSPVTSSTSPGSIQSLTIVAGADPASDRSDNIIVKLDSFGVPSSIDNDEVRIAFTGAAQTGNPSDIEIDGTTVTLVAPFLIASGATQGDEIGADAGTNGATITFKRGAGISLPIRQGDYDIQVTNDEEEEDDVYNWVTVRREISVKPTSGTRGTEITISGKGFSDGTAEVIFGDDVYSVDVEVDDGAFSTTVDTAVKNNDGDNVFDGSTSIESGDEDADRLTTISISDANEKEAPEKTFEIKPSFTFDPESPTPGQNVTITLVDVAQEPTSVTFTGASAIVDTPDDDTTENVDESVDRIKVATGNTDKTKWTVQVPGTTRVGNVRVSIVVPTVDDPLVKTVTIGTNDLTVTPTTVVPRQTISIDGDGFTPRGDVDLSEVTVDGVQVMTTTGETEAVNNNGNISFDISVPETVSSGTATVSVTDSGDRIGTATITIAKAEITVEPAESLRGETVTVSGTGFPANDLVLIKYHGSTVDTASTSPTGTFSKDVTVPAGSNITPGGKYKILVESQVNEDTVSDDVEHKIKDPSITLTPDTASPGSSISISGENFKGFLRVSLIEIGGQNVTPVPAPSTDQWGAFTATGIQVPQLDLTRHAVKVVVGDISGNDGDATEFITLVEMVEEVLTDPADVFASLIADGSLSTVWHLNAETQAWTSYSTDPNLADFNTLTEITGNQVYTLIMSAAGDFMGTPLFVGTNQVFVP